MAHKTFISYKYDEAQSLRDKIINALGDDAIYYKGETSDSPDIGGTTTENICKNLADMIYDTSVTIVIISPRMKESKWIDWEIEYSLKKITRNDRTSHPNGIVGVIMKHKGNYDWFKTREEFDDGCKPFSYKKHLVYDIINKNRFNKKSKEYSCAICETVNAFTDSYISYVEEEIFLKDPNAYIDNAYEKSKNDAEDYELTKIRNRK